MGRLPRLPITVFDLPNIGGHQSLNQDQLPYIDLATARQQRAYRAVREFHAIYVSRLHRRNAPLMDALRLLPPFSVMGWAWIYNSAATIRQGVRKGTDAIVIKTELSFNWIGLFKILAVGPAPASAVPDDRHLHDKLLYFDLLPDMPGRDSKTSHLRSPLQPMPERRRHSRHTKLSSGRPHQVRAQLLLHQVPPPFHVTLDDISPPAERLEVGHTSGHQLVCGRGGVLTRPVGPGFSAFHGNTNKTYNTIGFTSSAIGRASLHKIASSTADTGRCASGPLTANCHGSWGEILITPKYSLASRTLWLPRFSSTTLPAGAHL